MAESTDFFERFAMQPVQATGFDAALAGAPDLACVYFWGENCFNCEQFKKAVQIAPQRLQALGVHWFHANVYADTALGRRFGLHGVPAFYFFAAGRKLGRITGWQGIEHFAGVVADLHARLASELQTEDRVQTA
jgi:thioredoxin-like negative regulator of GroEL